MVRVLLIDDSEGQLKYMASLFASLGANEYEIILAKSLAETRQKLQDYRYDIILLDLKLPNGEGASMVRQVIDAAHGAAVVIITASEDDETFYAVSAEGIDGFIIKQRMQPQDLPRTIWVAMNRSSERRLTQSSMNLNALEAKLDAAKRLTMPQTETK